LKKSNNFVRFHHFPLVSKTNVNGLIGLYEYLAVDIVAIRAAEGLQAWYIVAALIYGGSVRLALDILARLSIADSYRFHHFPRLSKNLQAACTTAGSTTKEQQIKKMIIKPP
jgi:hypothetical protein